MKRIKNIILKTATVFALLMIGQTAMAQTTTDVSFSIITSFDDRDNALRIIGTESGTRAPLNILLFQYNNRNRTSSDRSFVPDCMPYIIKMIEQPRTYNFNISYVPRADLSDFTIADQVRACGLEVAGAGAG